MALLTFPRAIPASLPVAGLSFFLEPIIEVTPLRSGRQISADLGPTLWHGKWQSSTLDETSFGIVRSWYDTLLSSGEFYGYDAMRENPLAYSETGLPGGFDGTCSLFTVETNNLQPTLHGLPAGFVMSVGDYVAWDYSSSRALHRIAVGGTADGSGHLQLEVRPSIRTGWSASPGLPAYVYRAAARMIVLPGTYQESQVPGKLGRISFEAIQTL